MRPADWQDFAEMTGGATGALTGLLFVAVSLNAARIAGHQGLRASAAQTLLLFIAPLVMASVLLAPGQPDWVIGAELIVLGLAASWGLLSIGRVKHTLSDDDKARCHRDHRSGAGQLVPPRARGDEGRARLPVRHEDGPVAVQLVHRAGPGADRDGSGVIVDQGPVRAAPRNDAG